MRYARVLINIKTNHSSHPGFCSAQQHASWVRKASECCPSSQHRFHLCRSFLLYLKEYQSEEFGFVVNIYFLQYTLAGIIGQKMLGVTCWCRVESVFYTYLLSSNNLKEMREALHSDKLQSEWKTFIKHWNLEC